MGKTIDRQEALRIAQKHCTQPITAFDIYDSLPLNWHIMLPSKKEEYWYVSHLGPALSIGIASTYAIVISKKTGAVVYAGSAYDEG